MWHTAEYVGVPAGYTGGTKTPTQKTGLENNEHIKIEYSNTVSIRPSNSMSNRSIL
jgi:hypothetical protein